MYAIENIIYEARKLLAFANLDSWGYAEGLITAGAKGSWPNLCPITFQSRRVTPISHLKIWSRAKLVWDK